MFTPQFRKNNRNVPILSSKEINDIAEQFIADYSPDHLQYPRALNVDTFVEGYLDLHLDYQYLSK